MSANPFEVLRLDPSASDEEVVRQAGRLRQLATDEVTQNAIRQAAQALTGRTEDRLRHALQTHPAPCYRWPALERFSVAFRRPPSTLTSSCPPLDREAFRELLRAVAAAELEMTASPLEPLPSTEYPDEVHRETAELLWLSLLADMRA
jgi:hypothetical protein